MITVAPHCISTQLHRSAPSEANVSPLRGVGHDGTSEQKTREGRIALMRGVQSPPVTVFMKVSFQRNFSGPDFCSLLQTSELPTEAF